MNRLKGMNAYLAGPIDFVDDLGAGWREEMTKFLTPLNVRVFNPLEPIFHGSKKFDIKRPELNQLQAEGKFDEVRAIVKDVVRWDLRAVDLSSFIICNYDINVHQCGTMEEIFVASGEQSKPILFHVNGMKTKLPKWLYGRFPHQHMFNTWDELKGYVNDINTNRNFVMKDYEYKRWMFFADSCE